jgi:hypothetical protein
VSRLVGSAALALGLLLAACSGAGDGDTEPDPTPTAPASAVPELGAWHDLVTDPEGGVLLVNGYPESATDPGPLELWRWDGEQWAFVEPEGEAPSGRNFTSVALDTARDVLVLHGGLTPDGPSDETWVWDGASWSLAASGDDGPGPRASPSLAYDEAAGRVLLYGGDADGELFNDTWAWDGTAWERVAEEGPDPVRWPALLDYDPASERVVLYGGHQVVDPDGPIAVGGTWVWEGGGWHEVGGADQPGPLVNSNGVAHPEHGLLLVGGADPDRGETGEVWRWAGSAWEALPGGVIPRRQAFGLAYDASRDVVVLTGGIVEPGSTERRQDLWEWSGDPATPAVQVPAAE